jgi:phage N-6-adenine-methyltransferase
MNAATRKAMHSSANGNWGTPDDFWEWLDGLFHFDGDVDRDSKAAKASAWFPCGDALASEWCYWGDKRDILYCNPPYGRGVDKWLARGLEAAQAGATVVFLLPARTDTKWFHEYAPHAETWLLKGRLRFKGAPASAPFPSMVMVFRPGSFGGVVRCVDWRGM